jgi:gentisate 1,2-dioxygenase
MSGLVTRDETLPPTYSQALESSSLPPLWTALHILLPRERTTAAVPHRWAWRDARPLLHEAARLVPLEQAERRVLVLENPGLKGTYSVTTTLYAGLQVILPGEAAPSHHHTPSALRLVVEGEGAFTTVDGVKCVMEHGDFIITPPLRWHDHGHEGRTPVVWLDGLDIPMVRAFAASWVSPTRPARPPAPASDAAQADFRWAWRDTRRALAGLAASTLTDRPVTRAYVTRSGGPPLPTMGADAHWLRPGERARAGRSTASRVFHVIEGRGESRIGDTELAWEAGDTFVAPPWHWIEHDNGSTAEPACLFSFNDEPAIRALGLWQEERPAAP